MSVYHTVSSYPLLSFDNIIKNINHEFGMKLNSENELTSPDTVFCVLGHFIQELIGCDKEQLGSLLEQQLQESQFKHTIRYDLLSMRLLLPRLLRAAKINSPLSLVDITSANSNAERLKRLRHLFSGLINYYLFKKTLLLPKIQAVNDELLSMKKRENCLNEEIETNYKKIDNYRAEHDKKLNQLDSLQRQLESLESELQRTERDNAELATAAETASAKKESLEQENNRLESLWRNLRERNQKLEDQVVSSPEDLVDMQQKMAEDVAQRKSLCESRIQRLQEIEAKSRSVQYMLRSISEWHSLLDDVQQRIEFHNSANTNAESLQSDCYQLEMKCKFLDAEVQQALAELEEATAGSSKQQTQQLTRVNERMRAVEELKKKLLEAGVRQRESQLRESEAKARTAELSKRIRCVEQKAAALIKKDEQFHSTLNQQVQRIAQLKRITFPL